MITNFLKVSIKKIICKYLFDDNENCYFIGNLFLNIHNALGIVELLFEHNDPAMKKHFLNAKEITVDEYIKAMKGTTHEKPSEPKSARSGR